MAALHAQCRVVAVTVRFVVAPEHGMYDGEIIDRDWEWARALQDMTWRARAGDVYWRDEFADFQEYHNLAITAHDLAAPSRPLPPDALPAVCRTRAAGRSTEPEQAQCTPPQKLGREAR